MSEMSLSEIEIPEVFTALEESLKPMNTPKDFATSGIAEDTLAYWRSQGIGPKWVKIGRTVVYPKECILSYMRDHLYQSTAEYES